MADILLEFCQS